MSIKKSIDSLLVVIIVSLWLLVIAPHLNIGATLFGQFIGELPLVIAPLCFVLARKEDKKERFRLKLPSIRSFFGGAFVFWGAMIMSNGALRLIESFGYSSGDRQYLANAFSGVNPTLVLIIVALVPALCEEMLCRGYIYSAFEKANEFVAIIISAGVFALLHFSLVKLIPTFIIGLALGYITYKCGSILIGIIFHFINNALAVVSFYTLQNSAGADGEYFTIALSTKSNATMCIISFAFGFLFLFIGYKIFKHGKNKWWQNFLCIFIPIVIIFSGFVSIIFRELSTVYENDAVYELSSESSIEETFELKNNAITTIMAIGTDQNSDDGIKIEIVNQDGKTIVEGEGAIATQELLKKGKYTIIYSADKDESAKVYIQITAFGSFKENILK